MCHLITSLGNLLQFQQQQKTEGIDKKKSTKYVYDEKDTSAKKVQKIKSKQREREHGKERLIQRGITILGISWH